MLKDWVPPYATSWDDQRTRRFAVLVGVFVFAALGMELALPNGNKTIIGFELAGDRGAVSYLEAWQPAGLWRVRLALLLDVPFLVAYALGGAMIVNACTWQLQDMWLTKLPAKAAVLLLPLAAVLDLLEDVALLVVTWDNDEGWPDLARTLALGKFRLAIATPVICFVAYWGGRLRRGLAAPITAGA